MCICSYSARDTPSVFFLLPFCVDTNKWCRWILQATKWTEPRTSAKAKKIYDNNKQTKWCIAIRHAYPVSERHHSSFIYVFGSSCNFFRRFSVVSFLGCVERLCQATMHLSNERTKENWVELAMCRQTQDAVPIDRRRRRRWELCIWLT